jgi:23S rRNA pseudouridine2605 synthase
MAYERLQKVLAQAGIASRRACEVLITDGRVKVNGEVVSLLGAKADPQKDRIEVQGHGVITQEPLVYVLLHKPEKVVSTVSDPEGRVTVMEVMERSRAVGRRQYEGQLPRVYPVGRLDFDAEGLLLLTNDGDLAHGLLHPSRHVPKTYVVKVRGRPDAAALQRLREGVRWRNDDGTLARKTAPAEVSVLKAGASNTWLELTITEGRNHQVKRMCDTIGHFSIRLIRTVFGGVELGELPAGAWRFLTEAEVLSLKKWVQQGEQAKPRARKVRSPKK